MRLNLHPCIELITALLLVVIAPSMALAITRIVEPDTTKTCNSNPAEPTVTPPCYRTIQPAVDASDPNDTIEVNPGTYTGNFVINESLTLRGKETARTFLSSGGTGSTISITGGTSHGIANFTFTTSGVGITVSASSTVSINNNVFRVGSGNTAVLVQPATSTTSISVINNSFYQNGTAISSNSDITITNNIFSTNTAGLSALSPLTTFTKVTYNCFHSNGSNIGFTVDPDDTTLKNIPNPDQLSTDPLFVSVAATPAMDLHLKESSPCFNAGTNVLSAGDSFDGSTTDIGAYGGPGSDTIPFRVTVQQPTVSGTTATISWLQNLSYLITNTDPAKRGGYNVHYNLNKSGPPYDGTGATEGPSPVDARYNLSQALSGLSSSSPPTSAPVVTVTGFANQVIELSWTSVTGATGYTIYYTDIDAVPPDITGEQNKDVGNTTSFSLSGLINEHNYDIQVAAYTLNTYHIAVTAYDSTSASRTPGVSHESAYSDEVQAVVGTPAEGPRSTAVSEFPEPITPYPALPNKGCFIATAAYGYYSAPQVMALREFRDRYLVTNGPGRAFVRWYYRVSPPAAQFITEHPSLKPIVRLALAPAVGTALFMTGTSSAVKLLVFTMMLSLALYVRQKRINRLPEEETEK